MFVGSSNELGALKGVTAKLMGTVTRLFFGRHIIIGVYGIISPLLENRFEKDLEEHENQDKF
jgi:hypothetical protein